MVRGVHRFKLRCNGHDHWRRLSPAYEPDPGVSETLSNQHCCQVLACQTGNGGPPPRRRSLLQGGMHLPQLRALHKVLRGCKQSVKVNVGLDTTSLSHPASECDRASPDKAGRHLTVIRCFPVSHVQGLGRNGTACDPFTEALFSVVTQESRAFIRHLGWLQGSKHNLQLRAGFG